MIGFLSVLPLFILYCLGSSYEFRITHYIMLGIYFIFLIVFGSWWDKKKLPSLREGIKTTVETTIFVSIFFFISYHLIKFLE